MEEEKKKAYSEVVEILKLIEDEEKIEKIPFEVVELIKGNSDPTYIPQISKDIPLEEQNLKEQTYIILGWIASKYWGEDSINLFQNKRSSLYDELKLLQEDGESVNDEIKPIKEEKIIRNAGVFNDIEPEILEMEVPELNQKLPILLYSSKWYQKIKKQIVKLFKILFRGNKRDTEGVN